MALLEVIHDYMRGYRHILDKTQDMKEWENVNFHLKYCDYFYDLFSRTDRPIFWELDKETVDELVHLIDKYLDKHQTKFLFWKRYSGDYFVSNLKNNFR